MNFCFVTHCLAGHLIILLNEDSFIITWEVRYNSYKYICENNEWRHTFSNIFRNVKNTEILEVSRSGLVIFLLRRSYASILPLLHPETAARCLAGRSRRRRRKRRRPQAPGRWKRPHRKPSPNRQAENCPRRKLLISRRLLECLISTVMVREIACTCKLVY